MTNRTLRLWPGTGLWRHHDFLRLWAAQTFSAFGSRISRTALPVVAILTIDATPGQIGVLSALAVAPGVLVGLLLGGWIDRSAKRTLLIFSDLVRAGLLLIVPLAAWFDMLAMAQLYFVAASVGALNVLFQIADNAYLPVLIGRRQLVEGNTKLEATEAVAEIGGPSIAGVLIELVTAPITLLFDAVSYLLSALFLYAIRAPSTAGDQDVEKVSLVQDFVIGLRTGFGDRLVRPLFLVEGVGALFGGFFLTLYMIFTIDTLGLSPALVGSLIGLGGVGALLGVIIARRVETLLGLGPAMLLYLGAGQLAALLIPLASGPDWMAVGLLAAHQLLGDAAMMAYAIHAVSLRQTVLPPNQMGRATATLHVLTGLLLPIGALLSGWLATQFDVRTAIWIGVLGGLLAPVFLIFSPIPMMRKMPTRD